MKNIVLIGMPGCGKSTIGVILAKTLGMSFVDTDLIIQQRENRLLQNIIDKDGLESFLDIERDAILSVDCKNSIISTGGSAVFRKEAMTHLKNDGIIIFIDVAPETLKKRLSNIKTRGIAAGKDESVDDIFNQRLPLYKEYADFVLTVENESVETSVERLVEILKS